jgi:hypothetical protein
MFRAEAALSVRVGHRGNRPARKPDDLIHDVIFIGRAAGRLEQSLTNVRAGPSKLREGPFIPHRP